MERSKQFPFQTMINAAKSNDLSYDGKFWLGVKSTRIYCLPSCKARFPLLKNITFFSTREEAIANGYRGCKRCMSEFYPKVKPNWLDNIVDFLQAHPTRKVSTREITRLVEVDITTIRRYFKHHYGISPMTYHRRLRLAYAKKQLENGIDIKIVSNLVGFTSIEGFIQAFKKEYGNSPRMI